MASGFSLFLFLILKVAAIAVSTSKQSKVKCHCTNTNVLLLSIQLEFTARAFPTAFWIVQQLQQANITTRYVRVTCQYIFIVACIHVPRLKDFTKVVSCNAAVSS